MKLRPTKSDRKAIEVVKKATGQATYTKAIMQAVRSYPEMEKKIAELEQNLRAAYDENQILTDAAGFLLDGIEVLKRITKDKEQ